MANYTTTNAPLPWMEPYMQDYMSRVQDYANTGYQQSPGSYTGPNNLLQSGWQAAANRAASGSPEMSAARSQLTNTINGGFLNSNPYLDQNIQNAQGDLVRSYNSVNKPAWDKAMGASGSFGNSGVMEYAQNDRNDLMGNLGKISSNMRMQNYGQERNLQQQAMSMAPTFANQDYTDINNLLNAGNQMQGFNNAQQQQQQQWWQEAQNYPANRLQMYGNALGINAGGTSNQQAPDPSTFSQVAGGALTGAALWNALFGGK